MKSLAAEHELYEGAVGLQISIRKYDDVTILDLRGRSTIDGGASELLSSHLQELVANGARKVLLNLANLTQVDSSGVGVIIDTYVSLKRQVGGFIWACVLQITKFRSFIGPDRSLSNNPHWMRRGRDGAAAS